MGEARWEILSNRVEQIWSKCEGAIVARLSWRRDPIMEGNREVIGTARQGLTQLHSVLSGASREPGLPALGMAFTGRGLSQRAEIGPVLRVAGLCGDSVSRMAGTSQLGGGDRDGRAEGRRALRSKCPELILPLGSLRHPR
jgi:hypothetical protein